MNEPSHRTQPPRMPHWVKVSLIIAGVVILLVVVLMLAGVGGQHGPGRHTSVGVSR